MDNMLVVCFYTVTNKDGGVLKKIAWVFSDNRSEIIIFLGKLKVEMEALPHTLSA